jgi:multimeric flavodoxin WrbA
MKVILLNCGPHEKGCVREALSEIEKTLKIEGIDSQIFWLGAKPIAGCLGCWGCQGKGKCVIDDKVNEFLSLAETADGFVFGAPVHFASACGQSSSFLDRAFFASRKSDNDSVFRLKPGAAIVSARRAGTTAALDRLNKYFTIQQMPLISSCYWNMVHGNTPEEVRKDEEGLYIMRVLARNMAFVLRCLKAGKEAGVKPPVEEASVTTNFIR